MGIYALNRRLCRCAGTIRGNRIWVCFPLGAESRNKNPTRGSRPVPAIASAHCASRRRTAARPREVHLADETTLPLAEPLGRGLEIGAAKLTRTVNLIDACRSAIRAPPPLDVWSEWRCNPATPTS